MSTPERFYPYDWLTPSRWVRYDGTPEEQDVSRHVSAILMGLPRPFRAHTSLGTLGPLRLGMPLPQFQPGAYRSLALLSLYRQWATYDCPSHTSRTN